MNDVNLNGPDLRLVRSSKPAEARASASPRAEVSSASAQVQASKSVDSTSPQGVVARASMKPDPSLNEEAGKSGGSVEVAVSQLNEFVQSVHRDLQFEVDNDLGETIVRVVDRETQEVIRQIPDEVALRLAEKLQQDEPLTLFDVKV